MADTNRKIEDLIDGKLRGSRLTRTSDNFTQLLMKRAAAEHKFALEESKWDRLVKYIIGSFSTGIIALTVVLGFISGSSGSVSNKSRGIDIGPAVETSNNYLERFLSFLESAFLSVMNFILNFFGLSANSRTFTVILLVVLVVSVFLAAEKFVLRGRLRSSSIGIK
jgi:hypothetical protein